MKSPLNTTFGLALALGIFANPAIAAITMDYVLVGNINNDDDTVGAGYGSVTYTYQIGKNEVTNAQYAEFLNAVAKTDLYGLYNVNMNSSAAVGGITQSGTSGSFSYAAKSGMENRPVSWVSWLDAARFANWMHNGQKTDGTAALSAESGAYTLNGTTTASSVARSGTATVWLPSEDEWYKAAYYDPNKGGTGGYWTQANQTNTLASNTVGVAGAANYTISGNSGTGSGATIKVTTVGAYGVNSDSAYGTNDQAGNVREFTDTIFSGTGRVSRGGSYDNAAAALSSSVRLSVAGTAESGTVGFRIATIPEPTTALFSILAIGTSLVRRNRRSH